MLIGIISDTHDHIDNTNKTIEQLNQKGCKVLIHCGDFTSPFMMSELKKFNGDIHACFGNIDDRYNTPKKAKDNNIDLQGDHGFIEIDNKKIAFTHFPVVAQTFASQDKYNIVFHGHTHKKREEKINNTLLINPGEIMGRIGTPSYAIYNTENDSVEFFDI